jgi:hypothetical protein
MSSWCFHSFYSQLDDSHFLVVREFGLVWLDLVRFGLGWPIQWVHKHTYIHTYIIAIILMLAEAVMTKKATSLEDYVMLCYVLFCCFFVDDSSMHWVCKGLVIGFVRFRVFWFLYGHRFFFTYLILVGGVFHHVLVVFPTLFPMCSPKLFPIAPHFYPHMA